MLKKKEYKKFKTNKGFKTCAHCGTLMFIYSRILTVKEEVKVPTLKWTLEKFYYAARVLSKVPVDSFPWETGSLLVSIVKAVNSRRLHLPSL